MGLKNLLGGQTLPKETHLEVLPPHQVVEHCFCPNGHSILSDQHQYDGYPGILLKLKAAEQEGLLSLSPIIGDPARTFHNFRQQNGDVIDICCPVCDTVFPIYNQCGCGAHLIALFTSQKNDYSDCIGICQRIGCLNAEIISGRELRLLDRVNYF
ncbi:hypothetical protein [Malonomonas rubra]|uniref:hypothetical protein n=1 Tax=Malonomonas rubra TaxID=57040 RepID=UPI0026F1156E|nr:hypothetical protein [Malonomonas rubra]